MKVSTRTSLIIAQYFPFPHYLSTTPTLPTPTENHTPPPTFPLQSPQPFGGKAHTAPEKKAAMATQPAVYLISLLLLLVTTAAIATTAHNLLDVQAELHRLATAPETAADVSHDDMLSYESKVNYGGDSLVIDIVHRDDVFRDSTTSSHPSNFTATLLARLARDEARVASFNTKLHKALNNNTIFDNQKYKPSRDFSSSVISGLSEGSGEYFTRIGIGMPPRYNYMVLDTGSDLMWLQCKPCSRCYKQKDPLFDPLASSSYRHVPCSTRLCNRLDASGCRANRYCLYQVTYGDGSFTVGDFSTETITFRGKVVPHLAIGCGHDNEGLFVGAAGLMGLGRGPLSLPSQTAPVYRRRFSYCLVDRDSVPGTASSLIFGTSAIPRGAVFTPMLVNPKMDTFYYVELVGMSVGGRRITLPSEIFKLDNTGNGGVIVDCGTSVTRLVSPAYIALRDAFRAGTRRLKNAPAFSLFDTCYDLSGLKTIKVPTVVLHFQGLHADVSLPASNYLIPVDPSGIFCFAFAGNNGGLNIIGNIQQQGFRVVFDSQQNRLGFAPGACSAP